MDLGLELARIITPDFHSDSLTDDEAIRDPHGAARCAPVPRANAFGRSDRATRNTRQLRL